MILRRVAEHLRKQEWTAIGIDFLIVVQLQRDLQRIEEITAFPRVRGTMN